MKHMKKIFFVGIMIVGAAVSHAQERQSITMPYKHGEITFQYYEKDGIKVPDGSMVYKNEKGTYTEKGNNKDGYKDGEWIQILTNKAKKPLVEAHYTYKEGLLEGKTTYTDYKGSFVYNFHKGHLVGENKVISTSDTVYCNFDEMGRRIGLWKIIRSGNPLFIEFEPDGSEKGVAYRMDILGQKEEADFNDANLKIAIPFIFFESKFKTDPGSIRQVDRVALPTLSKNKYGIVDQLKPIKE